MQRCIKCCSARHFLTNLATLEGLPLFGLPLGGVYLHRSPQMAQSDLISQIVETNWAILLVGHFNFVVDLCKGVESDKNSLKPILMWCEQLRHNLLREDEHTCGVRKILILNVPEAVKRGTTVGSATLVWSFNPTSLALNLILEGCKTMSY
ncbi:hypothetical protein DL96DRAFT_1567533 [Flagelloscypha sp. PMI_526]|nr:hypothetical protein DL96DRAFT_1567533 [Flagelloscypha sp. PMI_526]